MRTSNSAQSNTTTTAEYCNISSRLVPHPQAFNRVKEFLKKQLQDELSYGSQNLLKQIGSADALQKLRYQLYVGVGQLTA